MGCVDITNDQTFYNIETCIQQMIIDALLYFFLAFYLDHIIPTEYGSADHSCFCLDPRWCFGVPASESDVEPYSAGEEKENMDGNAQEKDVEDKAIETLKNEYDSTNAFVEIKRLKKTFGGNLVCGCYQPHAACCAAEDTAALLCCCCCHGCCGVPYPTLAPKFRAVTGVSYTIPTDELFCLLGPNGKPLSPSLPLLRLS
jgi:hypothetical protein